MTWLRACDANACIEAARIDAHVHLRSTADPTHTHLIVTPAEFAAFVAGVKAGVFDGLLADVTSGAAI